jgi:hypothetical protein
MTEEKKFKVLTKDVTETGRSLIVLEDDSRKYNIGIAPKNYNAKVGERIAKTKGLNFVFPHMQGIDKINAMYEKLKEESK